MEIIISTKHVLPACYLLTYWQRFLSKDLNGHVDELCNQLWADNRLGGINQTYLSKLLLITDK